MATVTERALPVRVKGCCAVLPPALPEARSASLAALFKALGDPTRVQMLAILRRSPEPVCVCDLTAAFDLGQPTVSHHLARLREAGLVTSTRRGIWAFYAVSEDLTPEARAVLDLVD